MSMKAAYVLALGVVVVSFHPIELTGQAIGSPSPQPSSSQDVGTQDSLSRSTIRHGWIPGGQAPSAPIPWEQLSPLAPTLPSPSEGRRPTELSLDHSPTEGSAGTIPPKLAATLPESVMSFSRRPVTLESAASSVSVAFSQPGNNISSKEQTTTPGLSTIHTHGDHFNTHVSTPIEVTGATSFHTARPPHEASYSSPPWASTVTSEETPANMTVAQPSLTSASMQTPRLSTRELHPEDTSVQSSSVPPASSAAPFLTSSVPHHVSIAPPKHDDTPQLDVGDEDATKEGHHLISPMDPILASLVSLFIVSTAVASIILFVKFRQRTGHPEFQRLHDLPMDDLLEDTPLSGYTY